MKYILTLLLILCTCIIKAQKIEALNSNTKFSFRGLSVVDDNIIWASGNNGTVIKSIDGGKTFISLTVKGFEKNDFRDIEAFDSNTAIIIAISSPAYILKTIDGGNSWNVMFKDTAKDMFLDAMYFKDELNGIVVGDPINNKTFIATTNDGGNTWQVKNETNSLEKGEAFFASSGSNIALHKNDTIYVSGGKSSNLYFNNIKYQIPINKGLESTGANSISLNKNKAIIVGGDFAKDSIATNNCVLFNLKTKVFEQPKTNPTGYRSCVTFLNKKKAISCGTNGVDYSDDGGKNWKSISTIGYHVVAKAKKGNAIFMAGGKGRIGKLNY